jgi:hypothetical protein
MRLGVAGQRRGVRRRYYLEIGNRCPDQAGAISVGSTERISTCAAAFRASCGACTGPTTV